MIAALCAQNLIAPQYPLKERVIEQCLRPRWKLGKLPTLLTGQVLVMDNATFHKGGRIEQLIQNAGCKVLYLPPYSPDLNKIEQRRVLVKESNSQKTQSV